MASLLPLATWPDRLRALGVFGGILAITARHLSAPSPVGADPGSSTRAVPGASGVGERAAPCGRRASRARRAARAGGRARRR